MWKTIVPGNYVKQSVDRIDVLEVKADSGIFIQEFRLEVKEGDYPPVLTKSQYEKCMSLAMCVDAQWDIPSLGDLNKILKSKSISEITLPVNVSAVGEWRKYNGRGNCADQEFFCRQKDEFTYQCVFILEWEHNATFSVYVWEVGQLSETDILEYLFDFVEFDGTLPLDILHMLGDEALDHGASGMDKTYHDLPSREAAEDLMYEVYGIPKGV